MYGGFNGLLCGISRGGLINMECGVDLMGNDVEWVGAGS